MNHIDRCQAFLNRESVTGVEYQHNDYVRVIDGPHQGKTGSLVSLLTVETEPKFLVELEEGGDIEIRQSQLCFISHDS
jgi:ribosomal protein S4E